MRGLIVFVVPAVITLVFAVAAGVVVGNALVMAGVLK